MSEEYILSLSYGKDSMACLGAIEKLGLPLTRIVTAEVWATDTIQADLPPMVKFKEYADKVIKERWGIEVEHFKADYNYNDYFYHTRFNKKLQKLSICGFPMLHGTWCTGVLKIAAINKCKVNGVQYIGIAEDEPERLAKLDGVTKISPLHLIGWTEADAKQWCIDNELLSPIYTETCLRGGCWFCHNQRIQQLRELRQNYPELWKMLMKWDKDSPVTFKADGHTVHDFDKRFECEDKGLFRANDTKFRWSWLDNPPPIQHEFNWGKEDV